MTSGIFGLSNAWWDGLIRVALTVGFMTVTVMALIYLERKILARFQMRLGPTRTGPLGMLQSLADALKLVGKEDLRPDSADPWSFELAPFAVFVPIFLGFIVLPYMVGWHIRLLDLGLLYFLAVSSVNIVGWVMAGWGSDNRYAMIGGMRAAAQGISYELPLVLSLLAVAMVANSLNLNTIVLAQGRVPFVVWEPMAFLIFIIAALAELNRPPFDIPVGESEVVGGPFIEYSGIRWSMFFLAEYAALFILCLIGASVFLGGYAWPLGERVGRWWQLILISAKTGGLIFLVFWVRASVPRLRIDQLMAFSWKVLLPLMLAQVLVNGAVLVYGWPDILLLITGLIGLAVLFRVTDLSVRRPRSRPAAVLAGSEAAP